MNSKIRQAAVMAAVVTAAALCAACSKLTVENVERLKTGMPFDEVVDIVGKPTSCDETLGLRSCTWGDDHRGLQATFAGGKLVMTSARNLR